MSLIKERVPSWLIVLCLISAGLYLRASLGLYLEKTADLELTETIWRFIEPAKVALTDNNLDQAFSSFGKLVSTLGVRKTLQLLPYAFSFSVFGISGLGLHIPGLFIAALTGLLLCCFAARHLGTQGALVSLFLWALLPGLTAVGTLVSSDALLALLGLGAIYLFFVWMKTKKMNQLTASLGLVGILFLLNAATGILYGLVLLGAWAAHRRASQKLWIGFFLAVAALSILSVPTAQTLLSSFAALLRQDDGLVLAPLIVAGLFFVLNKPHLSEFDHALLLWAALAFAFKAWPDACRYLNGCAGSLSAEFPPAANTGFYLPVTLIIGTFFQRMHKHSSFAAVCAILTCVSFAYLSSQSLAFDQSIGELPPSLSRVILFFSDITAGMILPAVILKAWLEARNKSSIVFDAIFLLLIAAALIHPLWGYSFILPPETYIPAQLASFMVSKALLFRRNNLAI